MPQPYDKTTHDGKTVDWITHAALLEAEMKLGYRLTIVQGSYHKGVSASAGTHDGGGCVDLAPWDHVRKVRVLRDLGFAIWHRPTLPGVWGEHIHGVLIGNEKLAPVAARQVTAFHNRRDGLAGNRADNTYHPPAGTIYRWPGSDAALALEKKAAAVLDQPKTPSKPVPVSGSLRVDGLDLSHHNTVTQVGLNSAKNAGVKYIYLKSTEGATVKDNTYATRRNMVREADMLVGAYHFARPDKNGKDGVAEARFFLANAKPVAGDMRPVLDLEDAGGLSRAALTKWVGDWARTVKAAVGCLPIVYTPFPLDDNFGCMLWVARYSNSNADPVVPKPWTRWRMRQFSDGKFGKPNSIAGMNVDLNTLHDGEDLDWLRIPVKPVAEPQPAPKPPAPEPEAPAKFSHTHLHLNVQRTMSREHVTADLDKALGMGADVIGLCEMETDWHHSEVQRLAKVHGYSVFSGAGAEKALVICVRDGYGKVSFTRYLLMSKGVARLQPNRYDFRVKVKRTDGQSIFAHEIHQTSSGWTGSKSRDAERQSLWKSGWAQAVPAMLRSVNYATVVVGAGDLNVTPTKFRELVVPSLLGLRKGVQSADYVRTDHTHGGTTFDYVWFLSRGRFVKSATDSTPGFFSDHDGVFCRLEWS